MASSAAPAALPATHNALVLRTTKSPYDIHLTRTPVPIATPGSAIIKVLVTGVLTYANRVYSGQKPYPYPTPFIPGSGAIGRISSLGPDASTLKVDQLVFFDCFIAGRDNPNALILSGLSSGFDRRSNHLMETEWRDSTYAEYAKVPLENLFALDEERLLGDASAGGLGYTVKDLMYLLSVSVPIGGLRSIDLKVGEKVIITPATGHFGSAAVKAALAMGAQVIAMGRNEGALQKILETEGAGGGRVRTVVATGDVDADVKALTKDGPADVFFDISPGKAIRSSHFKSCILSLARGGRVCLMGAHHELTLPVMQMLLMDITLKAKWMYEKEDVRFMVRLLETGRLKLGKRGGIETVGTYGLDRFAEAFETAAGMQGPYLQTVIVP